MEPGWYPDPFSSGGYVRWWDGERWGASTSVGTTAPTSSPPGAPVPLPPPPPAMPPPAGYPGAQYSAAPGQASAPLPLASWVSRAMAWLLDSFAMGLLALPFTAWLVWPAVQRLVDSLQATSSTSAQAALSTFQSDIGSASTALLVVSVVVSLVYTVPQNRRWGQTLGKRALGIRIRPLAEDVQLSWAQVLLRWIVFEGLTRPQQPAAARRLPLAAVGQALATGPARQGRVDDRGPCALTRARRRRRSDRLVERAAKPVPDVASCAA